MSARDDVLARIITARAGALVPEIPRGYRRVGRLSAGSPEVVALLHDRLLDYKAGVRRCHPADVPAVIEELTAGESVVVPPGLPPDWVRAGIVEDGRLTSSDLDALDTVVTAATAAAAETGTIVLDGSPDQGRRATSLVPDHHVCIVHAHQIVHSVPELLSRVDGTRPLTFISGPSATSDIELERVEGVHGPRRLDVILVSSTESGQLLLG